MNSDEPRVLRKQLISGSPDSDSQVPALGKELDLHACATLHFSSEHPQHPIDHLFDNTSGVGARRWVAGRRDRAESILLVFDEPVDIAQCVFEAEERQVARTQVVCAEYLAENDDTYRQCFIQEFNFSPAGATYQRDFITVNLRGVSRFRLTVKADKSGQGTPSLTTFRLYG